MKKLMAWLDDRIDVRSKRGRQERLARLRFGVRLIELRKQKGLTQKDLAKKLGTSQSVIARWENRAYDGVRLETLFRVAHALNSEVEIRVVEQRAAAG